MKKQSEICRICDSNSVYCFSKKILEKHDIEYYRCDHCGFLQTEKPYWLSDAYCDTLPKSDEGILRRNAYFADKIEKIIRKYFSADVSCLDYGGGYGFFTRMMRDRGLQFWHTDLFCKNLFRYAAELGQKYEIITALEVFEHLENPLTEFKKLIKEYSPSTILFSTAIQPKDPREWEYLSLVDGQHISFLSQKTLTYMAEKLGMNCHTAGNLHMLTRKQLRDPLSDSFLSTLLQKTGRFILRLGKSL